MKAFNGSKRIDFLIGTVGRILDHMQETQGVSQRLKTSDIFILDEADQMLEMGFQNDMKKIMSHLRPPAERQNILFSATIPPAMQQLKYLAVSQDHVVIDTVGGEVDDTHAHVDQSVVVAPLCDQVKTIMALLMDHAQHNKEFKMICFFTTARGTEYAAKLFNQASKYMKLPFEVFEMHSRKSQKQREKCAKNFRESSNSVLFSSDVSARGMDYPKVTFVLQVGMTEKQQYVHRIGRTARAGESGSGVILLAPFEIRLLDTLKKHKIDLKPRQDAKALLSYPMPSNLDKALQEVGREGSDLNSTAKKAYVAWMGYYNSNSKVTKFNKGQLVQQANEYAGIMGLKELPSLEKKTVGKMGLKGVPGLVIGPPVQRQGRGGGGGRGGHGGGRGGGSGGGQMTGRGGGGQVTSRGGPGGRSNNNNRSRNKAGGDNQPSTSSNNSRGAGSANRGRNKNRNRGNRNNNFGNARGEE